MRLGVPKLSLPFTSFNVGLSAAFSLDGADDRDEDSESDIAVVVVDLDQPGGADGNCKWRT